MEAQEQDAREKKERETAHDAREKLKNAQARTRAVLERKKLQIAKKKSSLRTQLSMVGAANPLNWFSGIKTSMQQADEAALAIQSKELQVLEADANILDNAHAKMEKTPLDTTRPNTQTGRSREGSQATTN